MLGNVIQVPLEEVAFIPVCTTTMPRWRAVRHFDQIYASMVDHVDLWVQYAARKLVLMSTADLKRIDYQLPLITFILHDSLYYVDTGSLCVADAAALGRKCREARKIELDGNHMGHYEVYKTGLKSLGSPSTC